MEIDPDKMHFMPLVIGPLGNQKGVASVYNKVQTVALQYVTEPEAIAMLLPDCYQLTEQPIVTVAFMYNDGVDFMAGRGYRIATVMVTARFDGKRDHVDDNYVVVMFEDDTPPILLGRERLGVPKLYADISPVKTLPDGRLRCETSLWGRLLFGIEVEPLVKQDASVVAAANAKPGLPMLGYKYIPSLEGPPDAAYPIHTPNDSKIEQLWFGQSGHVYFGDPDYTDISFLKGVSDALKTLPVHRVLGVSRSHGSSVLRGDLSRRLR